MTRALNVQRKYEALQVKQALLEMREAMIDSPGYDHEHVLKLRAQIRNLKTQLRAMDVMNEL